LRYNNDNPENSPRTLHVVCIKKDDDRLVFNTNIVPIEVTKETHEQPIPKKFIDDLDSIALDVLHRFLRICRWKASAYWVSDDFIPSFNSEYLDENEQRIEYYDTKEQHQGLKINFVVSAPKGIDNPITDRVWERISYDVISNTEVPIQRSLILNAQRQFSLKNYRLAIVEAITALDIYLSMAYDLFCPELLVPLFIFLQNITNSQLLSLQCHLIA